MNKNTFNRIAGYTIDQTILIVAVIAILVTMIIGSVGWDLLSRAGGTKLASHLRQVEQANGQFYSTHYVWPTVAVSGSTNPFLALIDKSVLKSTYKANFKNLLPSYADDTHTFGGGGDIIMDQVNFDGSQYIRIKFTDVPSQEYKEADEAIDGKLSSTEGRLRAEGDPSVDPTVNLLYYANMVN